MIGKKHEVATPKVQADERVQRESKYVQLEQDKMKVVMHQMGQQIQAQIVENMRHVFEAFSVLKHSPAEKTRRDRRISDTCFYL